MFLCWSLRSCMFAVTNGEKKIGQNYLFAVINCELKRDNDIMLDAKKMEIIFVQSTYSEQT